MVAERLVYATSTLILFFVGFDYKKDEYRKYQYNYNIPYHIPDRRRILKCLHPALRHRSCHHKRKHLHEDDESRHPYKREIFGYWFHRVTWDAVFVNLLGRSCGKELYQKSKYE